MELINYSNWGFNLVVFKNGEKTIQNISGCNQVIREKITETDYLITLIPKTYADYTFSKVKAIIGDYDFSDYINLAQKLGFITASPSEEDINYIKDISTYQNFDDRIRDFEIQDFYYIKLPTNNDGKTAYYAFCFFRFLYYQNEFLYRYIIDTINIHDKYLLTSLTSFYKMFGSNSLVKVPNSYVLENYFEERKDNPICDLCSFKKDFNFNDYYVSQKISDFCLYYSNYNCGYLHKKEEGKQYILYSNQKISHLREKQIQSSSCSISCITQLDLSAYYVEEKVTKAIVFCRDKKLKNLLQDISVPVEITIRLGAREKQENIQSTGNSSTTELFAINSLNGNSKIVNNDGVSRVFHNFPLQTPPSTYSPYFRRNNKEFDKHDFFPAFIKSKYAVNSKLKKVKVNSKQEFEDFFQKRHLASYLLYKEIPNGIEYRLHCSTNGIFLIYQKVLKKSHSGNVFLDKDYEFISPSDLDFIEIPDIQQVALECILILNWFNLKTGVIDITVSGGKHYYNDINTLVSLTNDDRIAYKEEIINLVNQHLPFKN